MVVAWRWLWLDYSSTALALVRRLVVFDTTALSIIQVDTLLPVVLHSVTT